MANFTYGVARQLDEMLRAIVRGTHPNSFRVLAFTTRRLRGESREVAWDALDLDHWFCAKRKAFARTYIFSECSEFWIWSSITLMRNVLSSIHSLRDLNPNTTVYACYKLLEGTLRATTRAVWTTGGLCYRVPLLQQAHQVLPATTLQHIYTNHMSCIDSGRMTP